MCHLAPYSKNILKKCKNELTEFFASRKLAVDFLHFKVNINSLLLVENIIFSVLESCWEEL